MSGLSKQARKRRRRAGRRVGPAGRRVGGRVQPAGTATRYRGGQAVRYLAAGLVLAAWAWLRHQPLPRPAGQGWAWLAALAVIGLAGCSAMLIEATRVTDPASVGVVIGAAPLVIIIAAAIGAGRRPDLPGPGWPPRW